MKSNNNMHDFESKQVVRNIKLYILSNREFELPEKELEIYSTINKYFENIKTFISKDRNAESIKYYKFYGKDIKNVILEVEEKYDIAYLYKPVYEDIIGKLYTKYSNISPIFFEYMKSIHNIHFSRLNKDAARVAYENDYGIIPYT